MQKKHNLYKTIKAILTISPSVVLMSACINTGAPSNRYLEAFFQYTNGNNNQTEKVTMQLNVGNPKDGSANRLFSNNQWLSLEKIQNDKEKNQFNFFSFVGQSILNSGLNASLARANLIRNYYAKLIHNNKATITNDELLKSVFGEKEEVKKIFNGDFNGNTNNKIKKEDLQFAFAISNILNQGDGFANSPRSINFLPTSLVVDLGKIEGLDFEKMTIDSTKIQSSTTTNTETTVASTETSIESSISSDKTTTTTTTAIVTNGNSDSSLKSIKMNANDYVKLTIKSAILNFSFVSTNIGFQHTKVPDSNNPNVFTSTGVAAGIIKDKEFVNNYFKFQGNQDLIPNKFQTFEKLTFNVNLNQYGFLFNKVNKPTETTTKTTESDSNTNTKDNYFLNANYLAWNDFTNKDQLFDLSLINYVNSLTVLRRENYQSNDTFGMTLSHYLNNHNIQFPNNRNIMDFSKQFNGFENESWASLKSQNINTLLFSLFKDFKFDSSLEHQNSNIHWLTTKEYSELTTTSSQVEASK